VEIQELIDRQLIQDAIYRYCRGVDRLDKELIASSYHPDAWDDHGTFKVRGTECADVIVARIAQQASSSMHCITNVLYERIARDVVNTEAYFVAWLAFERGNSAFTRGLGGRYIDRFERRDSIWRIANRVVVHEWSRIDPIAEAWPPSLNMHQGRRSRDDITYTGQQLDRDSFVSGVYSGPEPVRRNGALPSNP
jgi:SnoaL-like domain